MLLCLVQGKKPNNSLPMRTKTARFGLEEPSTSIGIKPNQSVVELWDDGEDPGDILYDEEGNPLHKVLRQDGVVGKEGVDDKFYGKEWRDLYDKYEKSRDDNPTHKFYKLVTGFTGDRMEEAIEIEDFETVIGRIERQRNLERAQAQWSQKRLSQYVSDYNRLAKEITDAQGKLLTMGLSGELGSQAENDAAHLEAMVDTLQSRSAVQRALELVVPITAYMRKPLKEFSGIRPTDDRGVQMLQDKQTAIDLLSIYTRRSTGEETDIRSLRQPQPTFMRQRTRLPTSIVGGTLDDLVAGLTEEETRGSGLDDIVNSLEKGKEKTEEPAEEPVMTEEPDFDMIRRVDDAIGQLSLGVRGNINVVDILPAMLLTNLSTVSIFFDTDEYPALVVRDTSGNIMDTEDIDALRKRARTLTDQLLRGYFNTHAPEDLLSVHRDTFRLPWLNIERAFAGLNEHYKTESADMARQLRIDGNLIASRTQVTIRESEELSRAFGGIRVPTGPRSETLDALMNFARDLIGTLRTLIGSKTMGPRATLKKQIEDKRVEMAAVKKLIEAGPSPFGPGLEDPTQIPYAHRPGYALSPLVSGKMRVKAMYQSATRKAYQELVEAWPEVSEVDYEAFQFDTTIQTDFAYLVSLYVGSTGQAYPQVYSRDRLGRFDTDKMFTIRKMRSGYVWNRPQGKFVNTRMTKKQRFY